jgi:hypothetical protein
LFQTKVVEEIKTHILYYAPFFFEILNHVANVVKDDPSKEFSNINGTGTGHGAQNPENWMMTMVYFLRNPVLHEII